MHIVQLTVGDWSDDGHGKVDNTLVKSNLNKDDVLKAYKDGCKVCGFDITKYCEDYEDNSVPMELIRKVPPKILDSLYEETDEEYGATSEDFAQIYLWICKQGNPNFVYKVFVPKEIHIGGYGLFE